MARWKWEGFNQDGKRVNGSEDVSDDKELRKILRAKNIRPIRVTPPSLLEVDLNQWMIDQGLVKPFGAKELTHFTRQFSVMLNAGIPILQALEILFKQEKNPSLKNAIKRMSKEVGEGKTLAEAMASQKGFSKLYTNLVKAGEAGGVLDTILTKLSIYLDKQEKLKGQLKSAMSYPIIVIVIGMVVIYAMLTFVVPKMAEMLRETGQELPWITQMVMDVSKWLQNWSYILVPSIVIAGAILSQLAKSPGGKPVFDKIMMNLPIFGGVVIKGNLAAFSRTLSTMLSSGVSLIDSLDICIETIPNTWVAKDLKKAKTLVTQGKTLYEPLSKITYFPDMVAQMVKIGETTGNIDQMLEKVADIFEEETETLVGGMTKMIEPFILVFLGGFTAVILIAMYLPVFMAAGGAGG